MLSVEESDDSEGVVGSYHWLHLGDRTSLRILQDN
jgi:hypothetical protein